MISINTRDYNLDVLNERLENERFTVKYGYRIYGLMQQSNPTVILNIPNGLISAVRPVTQKIENWLKNNGMDIMLRNTNKRNEVISIGLRKDVREHVDFIVKLIKTIIFAFEDIVNFDENFVIPNCPKFESKSK